MKLLLLIGLPCLLIAGLIVGKFIGFHYPVIITDQPYTHGIVIIKIESDKLFLENGMIVQLGVPWSVKSMKSSVFNVGDSIELDLKNSPDVIVKTRREGWICGTPWGQPIVIPIFKDIVYKNRIEPVFLGKIIAAN